MRPLKTWIEICLALSVAVSILQVAQVDKSQFSTVCNISETVEDMYMGPCPWNMSTISRRFQKYHNNRGC